MPEHLHSEILEMSNLECVAGLCNKNGNVCLKYDDTDQRIEHLSVSTVYIEINKSAE